MGDDAAPTDSDPTAVHIKSVAPGVFDIKIGEETVLEGVSAKLESATKLSVSLPHNGKHESVTIVSQRPPPNVPASLSHNSMERIHVFEEGGKKTLIVPSPKWLLSLGGDVLGATKGALKAPMPSLVVEVKVSVGEKVSKRQAVVVLESMKTETVLRADADGIVKVVNCAKGEMVEEGRELVDIEVEESTQE